MTTLELVAKAKVWPYPQRRRKSEPPKIVQATLDGLCYTLWRQIEDQLLPKMHELSVEGNNSFTRAAELLCSACDSETIFRPSRSWYRTLHVSRTRRRPARVKVGGGDGPSGANTYTYISQQFPYPCATCSTTDRL